MFFSYLTGFIVNWFNLGFLYSLVSIFHFLFIIMKIEFIIYKISYKITLKLLYRLLYMDAIKIIIVKLGKLIGTKNKVN